MGMQVNDREGEPDVVADINTTPLIDVMLVLLVMLIITIPIQLHVVNLNLPTANHPPSDIKPEVLQLDIGADGVVLWNGEPVADAEFEKRLDALAAAPVPPELHVRPDRAVAYRRVTYVMVSAQKRGLTKVGITGSEQFL